MKIVAIVSTTILVALVAWFLRMFLKTYSVGFYYINKFEEAQENMKRQSEQRLFLRPPDYNHAMDLRGTPTHVCPCGSNIWNVKAAFDNFEIAQYFLDMECANCGSLATAPTPVDRNIN